MPKSCQNMTIWKKGGKYHFCWATLPLPHTLNSALHQTMTLFFVKDREKRSLLREKKKNSHLQVWKFRETLEIIQNIFCFRNQINKGSHKNWFSRYMKKKKKPQLYYPLSKVIHRTITSLKNKASLAHLLWADASCGKKKNKKKTCTARW